jgi:hypothetical protein
MKRADGHVVPNRFRDRVVESDFHLETGESEGVMMRSLHRWGCCSKSDYQVWTDIFLNKKKGKKNKRKKMLQNGDDG